MADSKPDPNRYYRSGEVLTERVRLFIEKAAKDIEWLNYKFSDYQYLFCDVYNILHDKTACGLVRRATATSSNVVSLYFHATKYDVKKTRCHPFYVDAAQANVVLMLDFSNGARVAYEEALGGC